MKHLGDITKLSGYVVPAVDVVIGGSPCQGLSVAGKQAGLKDERSGLFIEQIRLVKEMRKADAARGKTNDAIRPRYMVWENVPGAFSSNKGRDFEAVLEETVRVAEPKAPPVPVPAKEHPISLFHNGDGESRLWQILEEEPHPKYYLSGKACRGILTRAERRQKEIPALLKATLEMQAEREWSEPDGTESQNRK